MDTTALKKSPRERFYSGHWILSGKSSAGIGLRWSKWGVLGKLLSFRSLQRVPRFVSSSAGTAWRSLELVFDKERDVLAGVMQCSDKRKKWERTTAAAASTAYSAISAVFCDIWEIEENVGGMWTCIFRSQWFVSSKKQGGFSIPTSIRDVHNLLHLVLPFLRSTVYSLYPSKRIDHELQR